MLMIPGPSEPEPEALTMLSLPILPHYGSKWGEIYNDTVSKLQKVFKASSSSTEVIILPAPGQAAVEMAVCNLVRKGEEAFVLTNGFFSEMIEEIVTSYGGKPVVISSKKYGSAVGLEQVKKAIDNSKGDVSGKSLFVVHNETSTGVVNPVGEILKTCHERGLVSVLDSISAFGGIDVRVEEWKADFCIGYPSKALGGVFGAVPICISKQCWEIAKKNADSIHTRFLNLNVWRKYIDEWGSWGHPHPTTMPTSIIAAMNKALDIVFEEGLEKRYERHRRVAKVMRDGLASLGFELFPDKDCFSDTVSVAKVDPKYDEKLRNELLSKYNILVAGGLGKLRGQIIRVGHMGTSATIPSVSITLDAIGSVLREIGK
jgi:aspartate aminotransferase-like enzyme